MVIWMLTIVILPKFTSDSFDLHRPRGTVLHGWNSAMMINTVLASMCLILDLSCLAFLYLLQRDPTYVHLPKQVSLQRLIHIQLFIPTLLIFLILLQLFVSPVSDQFTYLLPLFLFVEEVVLSNLLHVPSRLKNAANQWLSFKVVRQR